MKKGKYPRKIVILICICLIAGVLIYPSIYDHQCKTRVYESLESEITEDVLKANIVIVQKKTTADSPGVTSVSYSPGASGVIFKRQDDIYYALTAYHVIQDGENTEYVVIPWGEKSYTEMADSSEEHISQEEYYSSFSSAKVVASDQNCDLAVIEFRSDKVLSVLEIDKANPAKGTEIATIGNPDGERFVQAFGKVKSDGYYVFKTDDDFPPTNTLKHNAYIAAGSSGSVVLGAQMKIVGINVGGGTDAFGRFKYGAMVPCEMINDFLENRFE